METFSQKNILLKKKQLFQWFYISCSAVTVSSLVICGGNNILPNLTNSQELEPEPQGAVSFWHLGARAA